MRQPSNEILQKLIRIGYIRRNTTLDAVIDWIAKTHKVEILARLVKNKWCYRYRWIKEEPVMFFGCRSKNGYNSQENALEAAILKIIKL